jgi:hypothetical protein
MDDELIGKRIAAHRKRRGMTHRRSNDPLARFRAWLGPDPEL